MDKVTVVGLIAATGTTISFLPQAIKIIQTHNTAGISLYMYCLFTVGTFFWLMYGLLTDSLPVIIANGITLVFASIILIYKIRFK